MKSSLVARESHEKASQHDKTGKVRITLLTIGAMGDTQPFVALGVRLKQEGYQVKLAARPDFAPLAAEFGIDFAPLGKPYQAIMTTASGTSAIVSGNPLQLVRQSLRQTQRKAFLDQLDVDTWQAVQGAEAIVFKSSWIPFYSVAEKMGVPFAAAMLMPLTPTRAFPSFLVGNGKDHGRLLNALLWKLTEQYVWQVARRYDNQFRHDVLGMKPLPFFGPAARQNRERMPLFYAYSPTLLSRPSDWPNRIHVTGFWFSDPPAGWQPPAELVHFLNAGSPPVYIGFGSMPTEDSATTLNMILKALAESGQRGILLSGWAGIGQGRHLPENVLCIEHVPHTWLFPKLAAVVHHGGAGTTGAGLRSGVPSIITPFTVDQPSWARHVHALGVGPAAIPYRTLTAERLANAIREAVSNQEIRKQAVKIGQKIRTEDGLGQTITLMRQYRILS